MSHALRQVLERFPLFGQLDDDELGDLARAVQPHRRDPGTGRRRLTPRY